MRRLANVGLGAGLLAVAVLPQAARAQTEPARSSITLRDGTHLQGYAHLSTVMEIPRTLLLSAKDGARAFMPEEVVSCQIGAHRFIVGGGFTVPDGNKGTEVFQDFIEAIDTTGQAQLFAYGYPRPRQEGMLYAAPNDRGGGGEDLAPPYKVYLLRMRGSQTFTPYVLNVEATFLRYKYKLANPADAVIIRQLFADDPVLQQDILAGRVSEFQLPKAVAAYNQGKRRVAK